MKITGLDNMNDNIVFHAGTLIENDNYYTNGGSDSGGGALSMGGSSSGMSSGSGGEEKSEEEKKEEKKKKWEEKKKRMEEEKKKKQEERKAKIGEIKSKVGGFFGKIGQGIKNVGCAIMSKHPAVMAAKAIKGKISRPSGKTSSVNNQKRTRLKDDPRVKALKEQVNSSPPTINKPNNSFSNMINSVSKKTEYEELEPVIVTEILKVGLWLGPFK